MANMEHLCRICVDSSTPLVAMLGNCQGNDCPSLLEMINDIMPAEFQVEVADPLPKHICQACAEATKNAFNLKRKYEQSQQYFLREISRIQQQQQSPIKLEPLEPAMIVERQKNDVFLGPIKIEDQRNEIWQLDELPDNPQICETCGQCFDTKSRLIQHMLIHTHTEEPSYGFQCPSNGTYQQEHPMNQSSEYKCPDCEKSFSHKRYLQRHRHTHTGKRRRFQCPHCPKVYAHRHNLNAHISIHTGEWAFKCPHCDNVFGKSSDLKNHMRHHTGERPPFACPKCPKAFTQKHNLKKHLGTHTNDSPIIPIPSD